MATIQIFLTSGSSWAVPSDWNPANNTIEVIGASGASGGGNGGSGGGAGAGAYSKVSNIYLSGNVSYSVGTGGTPTATLGGDGGNTWFNGTSLSSASVSAEGGKGGAGGPSGASGTGGLAANGIGTTKYSGGNGSAGVSGSYSGAGGGAAGLNGAGGNAVTTTGGSADNDTLAGGLANAVGKNGTEWTASYGSGSGGGGLTGPNPGKAGGIYGGAPSGTASVVAENGITGTQGLIVITYTPQTSNFFLMF